MAAAIEESEDRSTSLEGTPSSHAGAWLTLWVICVVVLQAMLWLTGFRPYVLDQAVDEGAARVEWRSVGELGDDLIREAIATQRATLRFWQALAVLGDFLIEPLAILVRAAAVTVAFSALAALTGRPIGFGRALSASAALQGFWMLGLATRTALMIALRRPEVETSMVLALPPGPYPAPLWEALRQLDVFAAIGWTALALGGWRRGQVGLAVAFAVCLLLWGIEAGFRISGALFLGAGMRLTLVPDG